MVYNVSSKESEIIDENEFENMYEDEYLCESLDEDMISPTEEGFMMGYINLEYD